MPTKETKKSNKHAEVKIPENSSYGTGKRKCAIAKVWVYKGTGLVTVNKQDPKLYFGSDLLVEIITKPLKKLKIEGKYDVTFSANGGGLVGQSEAAQLGVTRALLEMDVNFRGPLKESGYITRDPRVKERKKYGRKKARKGYQFRKR